MKRITQYIRTINRGPVYTLRIVRIRLVKWFEQLRFSFFQLFLKKSNCVVALSFNGKVYGDNPALILDKIHQEKPDTELIWLVDKEYDCKVPNYIKVKSFGNSSQTLACVASAAIVIDNHRTYSRFSLNQHQLRVQTWHGGLGMKRLGYDTAYSAAKVQKMGHPKQRVGYDFYLSNSSHLSQVYRTAFGYDGLIWRSGYPIEDELYIDRGERRIIHSAYGLPDDSHIVMYAPTFRGLYNWICELNTEQIVNAFQQRFGGKWYVMVHWHPNMQNDCRKLDGAIDVTDNQNIQELIKASDAFITDYSSSIFQAVQCDIPCFIYADDYKSYKMDRDLYYSFDELPFPYALSQETLLSNIERYDMNYWHDRWKSFQVRMGHIVTGHSAEDVAKVCVDFLNGKPKSDIMKEIHFETRF